MSEDKEEELRWGRRETCEDQKFKTKGALVLSFEHKFLYDCGE